MNDAMQERISNIGTQFSLRELIKDLIDHADLTDFVLDRGEDNDLGGWINATLALADGSTVVVGWLLYADAKDADAGVADEVQNDGWAIRPYGRCDIVGGQQHASSELRAAFARLADDDGCVNDLSGDPCKSIEELLAEIASEAGFPGEDEAAELWQDELRHSAIERINEMSIAELISLLR